MDFEAWQKDFLDSVTAKAVPDGTNTSASAGTNNSSTATSGPTPLAAGTPTETQSTALSAERPAVEM